jgi:dihydroorotase-like cyclic amidohydrolase
MPPHTTEGTIAVGSDADLLLWDADEAATISKEMLHDVLDYTPYEGVELRGVRCSCSEITVRTRECHKGALLCFA